MLETGVELLFTGDPEDAEIGREKLRTYVNATIGFERLASQLGNSPKSLMRMLSASGNPEPQQTLGPGGSAPAGGGSQARDPRGELAGSAP